MTRAAHRSRLALAPAAAVAALVLSGCGSLPLGEADSEAIVADDGLAVLDAWVRPSPPRADEAAIYVWIANRDAPDDRLVGAESPACTVLTPHLTMVDDDNVASMAAADEDQLGLARGDEIRMEPTGMHLMCLGLAEPLESGSSIEVTLRFADHAPLTTPVAVLQP